MHGLDVRTDPGREELLSTDEEARALAGREVGVLLDLHAQRVERDPQLVAMYASISTRVERA